MSLLDDLRWRYATKKMNGAPIANDKLNYILEAARLAPTSSGLQPFLILDINDPELKAKISPIARKQSQIVDCAHLLVFTAWSSSPAERVKARFDYMNEQRGLPLTATDDYRIALQQRTDAQTKEEQFEHNAQQAFIAFGMAIAAAAEQRIDATPMGGFNNRELDKLLKTEERWGVRSTCLLALGHRDADNDWLLKLKKVRQPLEKLVVKL